MLRFPDLLAAIFDVDDTLLDNYPDGSPFGLHDHSRLAAAHEVGKRHGSKGLMSFTQTQSRAAFRDAQAHTLQAAVWQMLLMAGEVEGDEIDPDNPLLHEMMELKDELHEDILRQYGRIIPGSTQFVRTLAVHGLKQKLAIASTAYRRDIDIYFEISGLRDLFPDDRIISRELFSHPKPHPEAFDLAFKALDLPEAARPKVAVFEDDPRGIASAKAAGLFVCALTTRFSKSELESLPVTPDLIAASYRELAKKLGVPAR